MHTRLQRTDEGNERKPMNLVLNVYSATHSALMMNSSLSGSFFVGPISCLEFISFKVTNMNISKPYKAL